MSETIRIDEKPKRKYPGQNRTPEAIERIAEMRKLRDGGATIQAIADIYELSRERVRQLIGNTGYAAAAVVRDERQRIIDSNRDLTTPELAKKLGVSARHVVRNYHHPIEGGGTASRGNQAEVQAADILRRKGFTAELMPLHHPFDILVNGFIRVDVKAAYKPLSAQSIIKKNVNPMWRFGVRAYTRQKCDIYFCMIVETEDVFIIPSKDVPDNMQSVSFCYPTERPDLAKWQNYQDAYDLIWAALEAAGVGDEN